MTKSVFSGKYGRFRQLLREAAQRAIANPGTITLPADLLPNDTS